MNKPQLVVVGNGMAGLRTLEELLALAPQRYDITVFGAEPQLSYNRIQLTPVLAGEQTLADIVTHPLQWYAERGIRLHLNTRVDAVDRGQRRVSATTADGQRLSAGYDRLLLATGSRPMVPPWPGGGLDGVHTYRDMADTQAMIDSAARHRHAVVIGGGLLGLEAANGLASRGMHTTVVHLGPWLLDRQLDATAAELLQSALAERGIAFRLGAQTQALSGNAAGHVRAVQLADGTELPADLVVVAAGIRPDTALAQAMGLHCERGIVVDDTLQTLTDARIHAVGECAAHRGATYGIVAPLYEQAKVCANHLAGIGTDFYRGSRPSMRLKVTGIDLFSAGAFALSDGDGDRGEALALHDPQAGTYKKLVLRDGRLSGACLYGDTRDARWYEQLIDRAEPVGALRQWLMFGPGRLPAELAAATASTVTPC